MDEEITVGTWKRSKGMNESLRYIGLLWLYQRASNPRRPRRRRRGTKKKATSPNHDVPIPNTTIASATIIPPSGRANFCILDLRGLSEESDVEASEECRDGDEEEEEEE